MKKKTLIILVVIFSFSFISLILYRQFKAQQLDSSRINIYDITGSGAKATSVKVYLKATYIDNAIANYTNNTRESFYVVFDGKVQYLVYMKNNDAKKIRDYLLDNPDDTYQIVGETKLITSSMEEYGINYINNWLNMNHDHEDGHEHNISSEDFYTYFGYVYIDATSDTMSNFSILNLFILVMGLADLLIIMKIVFMIING